MRLPETKKSRCAKRQALRTVCIGNVVAGWANAIEAAPRSGSIAVSPAPFIIDYPEVVLIFAIILSAVLIGTDQLLKYLATQYLAPVGTAQVVPGFVELRYVLNNGAAFSMLAGKRWLLVGITGVALLAVAFFVFVRRPKSKVEHLALILIFAGGVGNWVDRFLNGVVVDYINFQFVSFAIFNFADICVTGGFALLIVWFIVSEVKAKRERDAQADASGPEKSDKVMDSAGETPGGDDSAAEKDGARADAASDADG